MVKKRVENYNFVGRNLRYLEMKGRDHYYYFTYIKGHMLRIGHMINYNLYHTFKYNSSVFVEDTQMLAIS